MNYIGSKRRLLPQIKDLLISRGVRFEGTAVDLFSGTGVVAAAMKQWGFSVLANDWQHFAYVMASVNLEWSDWPTFSTLRAADPRLTLGRDLDGMGATSQTLQFLNELDGCEGAFYHSYGDGGAGGRCYFSAENGRRIGAIRDQMAAWHSDEWVSDREHRYLLGSLLQATDRCANTASVYGAYLKAIKRSANVRLVLKPIVPSATAADVIVGHALNLGWEDALVHCKTRPTLVYLDPPYNQRQYSANYHLLETVSRWDMAGFSPRGKTGLRTKGELVSPFCLRAKVRMAFSDLFNRIEADHVLMSYSSEGLLSETELVSSFSHYFTDVSLTKMAYPRFRSDRDHAKRLYSSNTTSEFLLFGNGRR